MAQFRFGEHLGSGGFGSVRRAMRVSDDGKTVLQDGLAVKTLNQKHLDDQDALARFIREVRLLDEELDHPNVMPALGRNLSASPPWFVMPYAETNLGGELELGNAGDREWVVRIFIQILEGMAHAHDRGVLHRDLKPPNLLFCDGVVKVSDFGLGKLLDTEAAHLTKTATWMGTEPYMAPEQFADAKRVEPPADVYALGKVLWEMLTGREPDVLHVDVDAVPREFRFFIEKCTRRDAGERFANAGEALASFRIFAAGADVLDPPMEATEKLVAEWADASSDTQRLKIVRRLDEHLARNATEEELYFKVIPRLPESLVDLYMDELDDAFTAMLRVYDEHISGGLPFSYCDVVARFYTRVFRRSDDLDLQRIILARLIAMGASHSRWFVGEMTGDLLTKIRDVSEAMMAAEVIDADQGHAEWFWDPWVKDKPLMRPIAEAFERAAGA